MPDLTTTEAATLLNVTRRRVRELIRLGTLKAEKFGRDWQVDQASAEAYMAGDRRPGRPRKTDENPTGATPDGYT